MNSCILLYCWCRFTTTATPDLFFILALIFGTEVKLYCTKNEFFLKYLHQFRKFKKFHLICPKKTPCGMKFVTDTEMVFSGKCGGQSVQLHQNEFLQTKRQKMFLILTFSSILFIDETFGCRMRVRKLKEYPSNLWPCNGN